MAAQPLLVDDEDRAPHPFAWALPLVPVAASVFGMSGLLYYKVQSGGEGEANGLLQGAVAGLYHGLGFVPSFMLCILGLSWSSIWFITGRVEMPWRRMLRILTAAVALGLLVNLGSTRNPDGGALGRLIVDRLVHAVGHLPSTILIVATAIAAMLLATDFFFIRYFESLGKQGPRPSHGSTRGAGAASAAGGTADSRGADALADDNADDRTVFAESDLGPAIAAWASAGAATLDPPARGHALDDAAVTPEETLALDPPGLGADGATSADTFHEGLEAAEPMLPPEAPVAGDRGGWRSRLRIRLDDEPPVIAPESRRQDAIASDAGAVSDPALLSDEPPSLEAARGREAWRGREGSRPGEQRPPEWGAPEWRTAEPHAAEPRPGDVALPRAPGDDAVQIFAAAPYEEPLPAGSGATVNHDMENMVVIEAPEPTHELQPRHQPEPDAMRTPETVPVPERQQPSVEPSVEPSYELPSQPPRQGSLFGDTTTDAGLIEEATRLVASSRRANAAFLRNRLRVSYEDAMSLLRALAERGVVEIGPDGTQARVLIEG